MSRQPARWMKNLLDAPETNVAIFSFLLNLVWEVAQIPLFSGMARAEHGNALLVCTRATIGDVAIAEIAFCVMALRVGSRRWILRASPAMMTGFVAVGVVITIILEYLATHVFGRWTYAPTMPVVPVLRVGLTPLLQWIILPPIVVWFTRRQLT